MWSICLLLSVMALALAALMPLCINHLGRGKTKLSLFRSILVGVFVAAFLMFFPIHFTDGRSAVVGAWRTLLLCLYNSMQIFTIGTEFEVVSTGVATCPELLAGYFKAWAAFLFVLAPVFTFSFVMSFLGGMSATLAYWRGWFRDVYAFSQLNERALLLAADLRAQQPKALLIFADTDRQGEEATQLRAEAARLGAICFREELAALPLQRHSRKKQMQLLAMGMDETENLNQALSLIERFRDRPNTKLYVFSNKPEGELLLTGVDKGVLKVRRIDPVWELTNRMLYDDGHLLFEEARPCPDGEKEICAVLVGLGQHGTQMLKALSWFGQMDGYRIMIHAFDKDPLAEEKFTAQAPELMSPCYNGVAVPGEAQYTIRIHSGMDVETASFDGAILQIPEVTYILVALGDDNINIRTASKLRMLTQRMRVTPRIQTVVYHRRQQEALRSVCNYRGQPYDLKLVGERYTAKVLMGMEQEALQRHLKWGDEAGFWGHEYNYRSSVASALHKHVREKLNMPGVGKKELELTFEERDAIEVLEHRRWNAYMRAQGYIYSGSKDPKSRNDLAKMHHDLVDFASLSEEDKRKDSRVATD